MPDYTWLRPAPHDNADDLEIKQRTVNKLKQLREALSAHIESSELPTGVLLPADSTSFIRLATWNIQEFDSPGYGYRTDEAIAYIAEIISHFDLIALQEIRRDLTALKRVISRLGPNWDFIATDVTEGTSGNMERMAFVFNRNKILFRHVVGELTLPDGQKVTDPFGERFKVEGGPRLELPAGGALHSPTGLKTDPLASGETKLDEDVEISLPDETRLVLPPGSSIRFAKNARLPFTPEDGIALDDSESPTLPEAAEIVLPPNSLVGGHKQFARTPFVASFQAGWLKINLAVVHIYYGSGSAGLERRRAEIRKLTELLAARAESDRDSDAEAYFIALGDFNIVHPDHNTMEALLTNNFIIPTPLQSIPGSNVKQDKHYDQIALWNGDSSQSPAYTQILPYRAGVFDFFNVVFRSEEEDIYRPFMKKPGSDAFYAYYSSWRTRQMSDHLPMWVELHIDFTDNYLDEVAHAIEDELEP